MDNARIDIRAEGAIAFKHSLAIFKTLHDSPSHYSVVEPDPRRIAADASDLPTYAGTMVVHERAPTMVLFWHQPETWSFGPVLRMPDRRESTTEAFLWAWLGAQPRSKFAEWCDHDGSMGAGFRMFNEDWTHVGDSPYAILALRPIFAWHGK